MRPLLWLLGERGTDKRGEPGWAIGAPLEHTRHGIVHVPHRHGEEVVAGIGDGTREELEQDDSERVDVGLPVHSLPTRLLGCDVVARAEHGAGLGVADGIEAASDPEVGHLRLPVAVDQHVLRLDVPVDEPARMCEGERSPDIEPELQHAPHGQRACALDELFQVLALYELEHDELPPVLLATVDHRDDARVRELRDGARLVPEALHVLVVVREAVVEDLQRDVALEQRVVRAVDGGHATLADELLQLVALTDQLSHHDHGTVPRAREPQPKGVTRGRIPARVPTRQAPRRARRR